MRSVVDTLPDPASVHDPDNRILYANRAFSGLFACGVESVSGTPCQEVVCVEKRPCDTCPHKRAMLTQRAASGDFYHSGLQQFLEITVHPVFDASGKIRGAIHYTRSGIRSKLSQLISQVRIPAPYLTSLLKVNVPPRSSARCFETSEVFWTMQQWYDFFHRLNPRCS